MTGVAVPSVAVPARRRRVPAVLVAGCVGLVAVVVLALFGDVLTAYEADGQSLADRLLAPGTDGHWLGTDKLGRDTFAQLLGGFAWSLPVGLLAALIATVLGTTVGIAAGWSEGWVRAVLVRVMEVAIAFPYFVLATAIIAVVGRGFWTLVLVLGLVAWIAIGRVVYAETRSLKEREYVLAARLLGMPGWRIVATYLLRGMRARITVMFAFVFADLLVAEAALSFLGIGAPIGTPSWGNMLFAAREDIFSAPWLLYAPAGAVVLVVLTANLLGDGLTDHWNVGVEQE